MQRIFFVISSMSANGAERVMSLLANYGAKKNKKIALALISSDNIAYELDDQIEVFYVCNDLPRGRVKSMVSRLIRLRHFIVNFKPDVVVSFLTTCNILSCLACIGLKIPRIISERNDPIRDCTSTVKRCVRNICYKLAEGFIFQTEEAQQYFLKKIGKNSIVIPNPVKDNLPNADFAHRKKYIVAAGRLTKQKNYPLMLKAFGIFRKSHPDYALHIYGDGEDGQTLKEYATALDILPYVKFKGLANDLHGRITDAGMYVLSSDYEGISNSLLECLAMGLPCISTDCPCGGSRLLIKDGENGLLVPVGEVDKLAEAMCKIAESDDLAKKLGWNAKKVREQFSVDLIISKYYDYIELIVNQNC